MRSRFLPFAIVCLIVALVAFGCASKPKVQVPPNVDLTRYGTIGIIDFSANSADTHATQATREFIQMVQRAQPGAPILELGSRDKVLAKVGKSELDFEAVRAIGEAYRVDAVFAGDLEVSRVKPKIEIGESFKSMSASANINGQLDARLMETRAGATVWSRRSTSTANVAQVGVPGGGARPTFGATEQGDVETGLVGNLVHNLRGDFVPRWVRQQ